MEEQGKPSSRLVVVGMFHQVATLSHPVPRLGIIDSMSKLASENVHDRPKTLIVFHQHILETTATLLGAFNELGFPLIGTDKSYSTSPSVLESVRKMNIPLSAEGKPGKPGEYKETAQAHLTRFWDRVRYHIETLPKIESLIVVDDGAKCCETMPDDLGNTYSYAWVEQTRGGLYSEKMQQSLHPGVSVGTSAAKQLIEAPLISRAILNRLHRSLAELESELGKKPVIGIVGKGAVGSNLARDLLEQGYKVLIHDIDPRAFDGMDGLSIIREDDPLRLINRADCILGAVGLDWTKDIADKMFDEITGNKCFISCTSEDRELGTCLKMVAKRSSQQGNDQDVFEDISCITDKGHQIIIKGGGYPYNFDRRPGNVPVEDIAITQGMMLGATLQAVLVAQNISDEAKADEPQLQCLDPYIQRYVVRYLKMTRPEVVSKYPQGLFDNFENIDWIIEKSGGIYVWSPLLKQMFGPPPLTHGEKYTGQLTFSSKPPSRSFFAFLCVANK